MEKNMFFPYLGMSLLLLGASYVIGVGLLRAVRATVAERYFQVFLALTVGLTVLVCSYAVAMAHGVSILLPVLGLVLAAVFRLRPASAPLAAPDLLPLQDASAGSTLPQLGGTWGPLLVVFSAAVGLFAVRFGLLYDPQSPFLLTPFQDYIFYSRLSTTLDYTGLETRSLEQFFPQFVHVQPYHYYELWLNAILVRISSLPAVWCLYLSAYTILTTIIFTGLRAVLAHFEWRGGWAIALAFTLLLVSGVYWPPFEHLALAQGGRYTSTSLLLLEPKLSAVYIFLILGIMLVVQRRWRAVGLIFAVLPLVFFTTLPAVGGVLVALVVGMWRRLSKGQLVWLVVPLVLTMLYLGAFYVLQPAPFQFPASPWGSPLAKLPHVADWHTVINIFIGALLNIVLYLGAYVALVAVVGWGRFRQAWQRWFYSLTVFGVILLASTLVAALAYTLTSRLVDSYQLLGNVLPPLLPIVLGAGLAALLGGVDTGVRRTVAVLGLLVLAGVNYRKLATHNHPMHEVTRFSPGFLHQVQQALRTTGKLGGFIMADKDYKSTYNMYSDTYTKGTYVADFLNNYALVSLSALDVDSIRTDRRFAGDTVIAKEGVWASSFVRFVKLNALKGRTWPKDSAQYQFVKEYGIGFVCVGPGAALPATLQPLVHQQYQDPLSGEKFYALNQ